MGTVTVSGGSAGEGAHALGWIEPVRFSDITVSLPDAITPGMAIAVAVLELDEQRSGLR